MSLDPKTVKKIAHLARLAVKEEDIPSLSQDLSQILSLVEKMDKADTKTVSPLAHPYDECQPMRDDNITELNQRALFQSIAPETEAGLYIVPQVIESE